MVYAEAMNRGHFANTEKHHKARQTLRIAPLDNLGTKSLAAQGHRGEWANGKLVQHARGSEAIKKVRPLSAAGESGAAIEVNRFSSFSFLFCSGKLVLATKK